MSIHSIAIENKEQIDYNPIYKVSQLVDGVIDSVYVFYGQHIVKKNEKEIIKKIFTQQEIENIKMQLKNQAHEQLAAVIAEMRDLDCECRKKDAQIYKEGFEFRLALLQVANEKLQNFMKAKYMEVATELKRDVMIFTGSNTFVFLFLLLISFLKPSAIAHLFLPGVLLVSATLVCSYFYIFEQNWLFTIIFNDYLGFAYLGYVGVVFLFLCDILFNRARVTTEIINAVLNAIGAAAQIEPC